MKRCRRRLRERPLFKNRSGGGRKFQEKDAPSRPRGDSDCDSNCVSSRLEEQRSWGPSVGGYFEFFVQF
jgi:hypothetical protein